MFVVEKAKQERQEKIVQAEGEAEAAKMISLIISHLHSQIQFDLIVLFPLTFRHIGKAIAENPGYLKLRKIRAAQSIARTVSE